jgi:8-oxo-dGTP diphosphatase
MSDAPLSPLQVVAGLLRDAEGRVLLAARPPGKAFAGRWEFPGGKIDAGEQPIDALTRELSEELGIEVDPKDCRPFQIARHQYPNAPRGVHIIAYVVDRFNGEPVGREGQSLAWHPVDALPEVDILEADRPIVTALRLGRHIDLAQSQHRLQVYRNIADVRPVQDPHEIAAALILQLSEAQLACQLGADVLLLEFTPSEQQSEQLLEIGLPWYVPATRPLGRATGSWQDAHCSVANSIST